jgi:hypothetical protein
MKPTHKVYCRRVPINSGGYDSKGTYWGVGEPLYHVQVLAIESCPVTLPKTGIVEPMLHQPGGQEYWTAKTTIEKWNEPFSEHVRAWDRDEAIVILRPGIGVAVHRLHAHTKVVSKRHLIGFEFGQEAAE